MFSRPGRLLACALTCAVLPTFAVTSSATAAPAGLAAQADRSSHAAGVAVRGRGLPPTELLGEHGPPIPMKDQAQIVVSAWGYRYMAGQQHSDLTITEVRGKVRFVDTGTRRWRKLPRTCTRQSVPRGVAALCRVPAQFRQGRMFLEVWPRLGNDRVDTSAMPARYRSWILVDAGNDTVTTGPGDDFVNGAQNRDRIYGGAGDDWLRSGTHDDVVHGGDGRDKIVGADDNDQIFGGAGRDQVFGGPGHDVLRSEGGTDNVVGGPGRDMAYAQRADRVVQCEQVRRS